MPVLTMPNTPLMDVRQIKVTGLAEIEVEPDEFSVQIQISSVKASFQMAEVSSKKRVEYARQEIQNFNCQIIATHHKVDQEIEAYFSAWYLKVKGQIDKIDQLISHLNCKLLGYLEISHPLYLVSCNRMKNMRAHAIKQAVLDARQKAETIASIFGQKLACLISVNETESIENYDSYQVSNKGVNMKSEECSTHPETSQKKRISTKVEPPKKKGVKKNRISKNLTVINGVSTADMTKEEIEGFVILLREELEQEKNERNLAFLEKDKITTFWELTKKQLDDTRALLIKKEREVEDADERHQLEMKVYKQKLKHLMFEQNSREAEAKRESLRGLSCARDEARSAIRAIRNENFNLKAKLRQQQVQSEEYVKQLKRQQEIEMAHIRQEFSRQTEDIENRSAKQMAMLREQIDTQRRVEVHNTEERKNAHIHHLEANHEKAFADMKAYYNDITLGNVSVIKTLRENIDELRLQLTRVQHLLEASQNELGSRNKQVSSMEKELTHLRHIAKLFDNEKTAHLITKSNAKKRLAEMMKLQMDYDVMNSRYEALDKVRSKMAKQFESLLLEAQQRMGLRALIVERKLTTLAEVLETREAQISQLLVALDSDPQAVQAAKQHLESLLNTKNLAIEELQYEVMRMGKAYNELWSACQRKLTDEMNNPVNLGIMPVKVNLNLASPYSPATALGARISGTSRVTHEEEECGTTPELAPGQLASPKTKLLPLGQGPAGLTSVAPF